MCARDEILSVGDFGLALRLELLSLHTPHHRSARGGLEPRGMNMQGASGFIPSGLASWRWGGQTM